MIGFTEHVLYMVQRDKVSLQSSKDLKNYLIRNNLMDRFLKLAGDDINFMLSRIFDIIHYCILRSSL